MIRWTNASPDAPIVVGGVGGSGTGAVAAILRGLNVHIGHDLNWPKDNLAFTLLFKHPRKYRQPQHLSRSDAAMKLNFLRDHMLGRTITRRQKWHAWHMAAEMLVRGKESSGAGRVVWSLQRARSLCRQYPVSDRVWGWKEPNSFLFLKQLSDHFPHLKYIHVIRHGLDMAFSGNQAQFENWRHVFDVPNPADSTSQTYTRSSLEYWIRANRHAVEVANTCLGPRHFLLRYDDLCLHPDRIVSQLVDFLSLTPTTSQWKAIIKIPRIPNSMQRYRNRGISQFDSAQISAVQDFGFEIAS